MEAEKNKLDDFIRASLVGFINDQLGPTGLDSLDEIVLGYVTTVVDELAWDGEAENGVSIDQEEFAEIMSMYAPQFASIPRPLVSRWILELGDKVRKIKYPQTQDAGKAKDGSCAFVKFLRQLSEEDSYRTNVPEQSVSSLSSSSSSSTMNGMSLEPRDKEMDYDASSSSDDLDFIEHLRDLKLHKNPSQKSQGRTTPLARGLEFSKKRSAVDASLDIMPGSGMLKADDSVRKIKCQILARYGLVDEKSDKIVHKPKLPKSEPLKMIRYRESHIVSTTGKKANGTKVKAAKAKDTL